MLALKLAIVVWATFLGLMIGGYYNVYLYRVSSGKSSLYSRSSCPSCGGIVTFWQEIPIASYLVLRGRCANCGCKIGIAYPLIEAACAAIWGATTFLFIRGAADLPTLETAIGRAFWISALALCVWSFGLFWARRVRVPLSERVFWLLAIGSFFVPATYLRANPPLVGSVDAYDSAFLSFVCCSTFYCAATIALQALFYGFCQRLKRGWAAKNR